MPGAPPTTATSPKLPLCAACSRCRGGGGPASTAVPSPVGTPSVCSQTRPAWSRPWPVKSPGFSVSSDNVACARTATPPSATPVSACSPEGRSTASTVAGPLLSRWMASAIAPSGARRVPRPSRASMARSPASPCQPGVMGTPADTACAWAQAASAGRRAASPKNATCTALPARCRCSAATKPSPPLLPGPASTCTRCACGAQASASCATARPARCISACGALPASACCSVARDVAASCNGQGPDMAVTGTSTGTGRIGRLWPAPAAVRVASCAGARCPGPADPTPRRGR